MLIRGFIGLDGVSFLVNPKPVRGDIKLAKLYCKK